MRYQVIIIDAEGKGHFTRTSRDAVPTLSDAIVVDDIPLVVLGLVPAIEGDDAIIVGRINL